MQSQKTETFPKNAISCKVNDIQIICPRNGNCKGLCKHSIQQMQLIAHFKQLEREINAGLWKEDSF